MLSVMVITKNEAYHLERCLASVAFATEIIVLDSGSTDHTVEIARRYTPHVHQTDWPGYGIQKQRALALTTQPWVLNIDADESLDEALQAEILRAIESEEADAYRIPIHLHFYGQTLRHVCSPVRHVRLFKRLDAHYSADIVHEKIQLPIGTRVKKLKNALLHHSFRDVSHMIQKMDRYSSYSAKISLKQGKKSSIIQAGIRSLWMFNRCFWLQLGFLDGKMGLFFSVYQAQASFYRAMKQVYPDVTLADLPSVEAP